MPHVLTHNVQQLVIPRMTEIIASVECEARAALHPVHTGKTNWNSVSNAVALAGTLGHLKVENYIRKLLELPQEDLVLSPGDKIIYDHITNNDEGTKWLNEYVETAFKNFLSWCYDFRPKFVVPEISMIYLDEVDGKVNQATSCKGTVDLICELDPSKMSQKAKAILPIKEPSTLMLDWKTGVAKLDSHQYQLEGYKWLFEVSGKLEELTNKGIINLPWATIETDGSVHPVAMCVRLGGTWTYMADAYPVNTGNFDRARKLFLKAKPIVRTQSEKYGERVFREGYHCVFCPYKNDGCPIFTVTNIQLEDIKSARS